MSELPEENTGKTFSIGSYSSFLRFVCQGNRHKNKSNQMGPNQTYKLWYSKGNHEQNERTAYGLEKVFPNYATDKGLVS